MKPSCRACLLSGVSSQEGRICNGCILDYGLQAEKNRKLQKIKNTYDVVDSTVCPPLLDMLCPPEQNLTQILLLPLKCAKTRHDKLVFLSPALQLSDQSPSETLV